MNERVIVKKFYILIFTFYFLLFTFVFVCYALDLSKLKICFLSGDYKESVSEGEKILANTDRKTQGLDELYYILGLSYLKDGNILRASDIFEIILNEFKGSGFREEAELGLADTYFLRENYNEAQARYKKLLNDNPKGRLTTPIYYRLSICASKLGNISEAKDFASKLKELSPVNPESGFEIDNSLLGADYYSVQVGSFARDTNAKALAQKLIAKGYPVFIEESGIAPQEKSFRVKVGKFKTIKEAQDLEDKLAQDGYPTRICP
ncbi:MAG: SPOR domain-containing protein [Candidatus Omnitrophica bacterium]|nr:SPOR domain-containing protein [Candidatus Omnitrophota bacterium]